MTRPSNGAPLRFGTDGWRARIAEEYTFENVRRIAAATARHFRTQGEKRPILIGYDTRFLSGAFARAAAESMAAEGVRVILSSGAVPTPAVSHFVARQRLGGGVVITASHNPGTWNGFKIKTSDGSSVPAGVTQDIESRIPGAAPAARKTAPAVQTADVLSPYVSALRAMAPHGATRLRVAVDSMHGATGEAVRRLFAPWGARASLLRTSPDPLFGGVHPKPIPPHIAPMLTEAERARAALAFCLDGDGDRIGAGTGRGEFVNPHEIFCLVLLHLAEDLGLRGEVVKTVSTTFLLRRICQSLGLPLHETPVGFKYIAARMHAVPVLIGGEESGGIAVSRHLPERDGLYAGMALVQMCRMRGKNLATLRDDLFRRFGRSAYDRVDLHLPTAEGRAAVERIRRSPPPHAAGLPVERVNASDGVKLELRGDAWLMFRASGTEPILRVYAEADSPKTVRALLAAAPKILAAAKR